MKKAVFSAVCGIWTNRTPTVVPFIKQGQMYKIILKNRAEGSSLLTCLQSATNFTVLYLGKLSNCYKDNT